MSKLLDIVKNKIDSKNLEHHLKMQVKSATSASAAHNWRSPSQNNQLILKGQIAIATYDEVASAKIMKIIWERLEQPGRKWKIIVRTLELLEYLICNGSAKVVEESRDRLYTIRTLKDFKYVSSAGVDHGHRVRECSRRIVDLLCNEKLLSEERDKAARVHQLFHGTSGQVRSLSSRNIGDHMSTKVAQERPLPQKRVHPEKRTMLGVAPKSKTLRYSSESAPSGLISDEHPISSRHIEEKKLFAQDDDEGNKKSKAVQSKQAAKKIEIRILDVDNYYSPALHNNEAANIHGAHLNKQTQQLQQQRSHESEDEIELWLVKRYLPGGASDDSLQNSDSIDQALLEIFETTVEHTKNVVAQSFNPALAVEAKVSSEAGGEASSEPSISVIAALPPLSVSGYRQSAPEQRGSTKVAIEESLKDDDYPIKSALVVEDWRRPEASFNTQVEI